MSGYFEGFSFDELKAEFNAGLRRFKQEPSAELRDELLSLGWEIVRRDEAKMRAAWERNYTVPGNSHLEAGVGQIIASKPDAMLNVNDAEHLLAWMAMNLRWLALSAYEQRDRAPSVQSDFALELLEDTAGRFDTTVERLREALERMSTGTTDDRRNQLALDLVYLNGMSQRSAACQMGILKDGTDEADDVEMSRVMKKARDRLMENLRAIGR